MENFFTIPWARLLLLLFIVYLIIASLTFFFGDRLLFPVPHKTTYSEEEVSFFISNNSERVACMQFGNLKDPEKTIIFSHGNGEDLGNLKSFLKFWSTDNIELIAYDYPGYGLSEGKPSEQGCYDAIECLYKKVTGEMGRDPASIIIWGRSLGTGPSLYLSSKYEVGGMILETPFLSAFRSVTQIPLLPWDRFRNFEQTQNVRCPSLVVHVTLDEVVPFRQGVQIYSELPDPKKFLEVKGAQHNNIMEVGGERYRESILSFIFSIGS